MDDQTLIQQIDELVAEEHALRERHPDGLSDDDRSRLHDLETHLDQCWDLLRQRRARREAGQPDHYTAARCEQTVEGYQQ
jgi:Rad3-related DNA helicase